MTGEDYIGVTAVLRARTRDEVLLDVSDGIDAGRWVPRSCLFGPDDSVIDAVAIGDEITLRIREWIADCEGLA